MNPVICESKFTRGEVKRTCPVCGKVFTANAPRHTYCSTACRSTAIGKRLGRVGNRDECPECKCRFIVQSSNQVYCSKKCRNKARGRRYYWEQGGKERMAAKAQTPYGKMQNRIKARRARALKKFRQAIAD